MAQSGEKHGLGRIEDRKVKERSESLDSVEDFFLKRKRDRTKEGEREEEGRAFREAKRRHGRR